MGFPGFVKPGVQTNSTSTSLDYAASIRYITSSDRLYRAYLGALEYTPVSTSPELVRRVTLPNSFTSRTGHMIAYSGTRKTAVGNLVTDASIIFNASGTPMTFGIPIISSGVGWTGIIIVPDIIEDSYSFSPGLGGTVDFMITTGGIADTWYISMSVFNIGA